MTFDLDTIRVVILGILALWVGALLTQRIAPLRRLNLPVAVTGGVLFAAAFNLSYAMGVEVVWDLGTRDDLLLVFFASVGLSAKLSDLRKGGALFVRLALLLALFMVMQNVAGILVAAALGEPLGYGLIAGSVSFAGGHGTAITWGTIAETQGYPSALPIGLAFATFGLISGGILGGPVASLLVRTRRLATPQTGAARPRATVGRPTRRPEILVSSRTVLLTLLLFAFCVGLGAEINRVLGGRGIVLPGFVTAIIAGVLITNLCDMVRIRLHEDVVQLGGEVSLHLFLAMSLISLELGNLSEAIIPMLLALGVQIVLVTSYAVWVVFRFCGRDYEAAVIAAGFVGIGLGATPVGMANMEAVISQFGRAARALLIVPLIGAGVLDLANALIIDTLLRILA